METGTIHHTKCPNCGNYTMDESGECHYAYCDEESVDDMVGEREFMRHQDNLSEDEQMIYGLI